MTTFYTNVQALGGKILYRGVKDGKRIKLKIDYEPQLYLPARNGKGTHKSLDGLDLVPKRFDGIREAREYVKQYDGLPGAPKIYGNTGYQYAFIAEQHSEMVDWEQDKVSVAIIDIDGALYGQSCDELLGAITSKRLIHGKQAELSKQILSAVRLPMGDGGWIIGRRASSVAVCAAVASALATHFATRPEMEIDILSG